MQAERTVSVPAGRTFFFPIANWGLTYPEDVPADVPKTEAEAWMRATLDGYLDYIDPADLVCEVDGVPLKNLQTYRAASPAFPLYLPEGSIEVTYWLYPFWTSLQGVPYQPG